MVPKTALLAWLLTGSAILTRPALAVFGDDVPPEDVQSLRHTERTETAIGESAETPPPSEPGSVTEKPTPERATQPTCPEKRIARGPLWAIPLLLIGCALPAYLVATRRLDPQTKKGEHERWG